MPGGSVVGKLVAMAVRKVGSCEILRELGRGGMGVVYQAHQPDLDRTVAIKELPAELAKKKEFSERFRREGKAYAQLRHQAIVAVHDFIEKSDALYLITEFVDGADLAKLLKQGGPLPPACAAVVGAKVAEALDYVHFHKLLHRDIKPANIMVTRDGDVKLMDFGIAKDQTADDLTREGLLVGSPSYLAPEVLATGKADPRSDIWALGVTLYELCCGEKPFAAGTTDELFKNILRGRYVPLRAKAPHVQKRFAMAIERCLAKKPAGRWPNATLLAQELDVCAGRYLEGFHPQGRLVALMTHRGFAGEEHALSRIDAGQLRKTEVSDAGIEGKPGAGVSSSKLAKPGRRWRTAFMAAVALVAALGTVAGAAIYFHLLPIPWK